MNDPFVVGRLERIGHLSRQARGLVERDRTARDHFREGRSLHQFQHERLPALRFLHSVDRGDVRMIQSGQHLSLALEPRDPINVECECFRQDLQCDVTIQARVSCPVDLAHRARADRRDDFVRADAISRAECGVHASLVLCHKMA